MSEASSQDFHRVAEGEWLGIIEGSATLRNERRDIQRAALRKGDDGGTPGLARTLSGSRSEPATLRREQLKQLNNQCDNRATEKEGETDHRHHKYSRRQKMAVCL
jgi:hypothetical protein